VGEVNYENALRKILAISNLPLKEQKEKLQKVFAE
jgi:hypothetical protein